MLVVMGSFRAGVSRASRTAANGAGWSFQVPSPALGQSRHGKDMCAVDAEVPRSWWAARHWMVLVGDGLACTLQALKLDPDVFQTVRGVCI
jgi:hypothetical protein